MMSPTGSAPSQAVAFHRQAVERLKKEIAGVDRNSNRRYIRDFREAYGAYQDLSSHDDLIHACSRADLIFFGDYHALPASQSLAAKLLGQIASRSKKVFLAMEMIFGRYQQILDRWLAGEMDEEEFLHRIRYRQEWGYDWNGFRQIFEVARMNGIPVIGIDCEPRNGFRFIRRRDNYAAEKIVDIKIHHPDAKVCVVIGESHLAPSHLPARVKKALGRAAKRTRSVVVLQNLEEIYWQLAENGKEQEEVVSLGEDRFCVFNTSPLAKYESYRQTIEKWREDDDGDYIDLTPTTYRMIDTLLRFLRIDKYTTCVQDGGSSCTEFLVD
ncbi:MAG: ChaN family lipoprotein, partial [Acidobacteriota bacterium]